MNWLAYIKTNLFQILFTFTTKIGMSHVSDFCSVFEFFSGSLLACREVYSQRWGKTRRIRWPLTFCNPILRALRSWPARSLRRLSSRIVYTQIRGFLPLFTVVLHFVFILVYTPQWFDRNDVSRLWLSRWLSDCGGWVSPTTPGMTGTGNNVDYLCHVEVWSYITVKR